MSDSDERELELLLQQLKENADIDLRCHAAKQLGLKKNKSDIVVPALIEALNDDNWLVRVEAATALSKIGRAATVAIESLKSAMNEPRNRPKRGIFYEVIQTLETAKSAEPEVEPIAVVEEKKEEITFEEKVKAAIAEGRSLEPVVEASEEVVEDPLVEEKVEVVTEEIVEEAKIVDEVVVEDKSEEITEEALEDAVEDVLEDAIEDIVDETVEEKVVEEIAEEIAEEETIGEDITEIVEDVAEEITEDTTEEEIIEEAIEEIAEEVLEDVLEIKVGDTVDHEVIDDIAEEITEEVLEKDEEEEKEVEKFVETTQAAEIEAPEIEPEEEEKKTTELITEAIPLDEVLEFDEDKKEVEKLPPTTVSVKTVRMSKALIKIVLVGDAAVGKTELRKKYCDASYSQEYKHILGADFATKQFSKNNENFSLQIWDIAAKERFDNSKELFFKSIFGALLVFDVTNRESFNNIRYWLGELRKVESKELALVIIGNKTDLRNNQEATCVTREEGQELASKLSTELGFDVSYVETNAITGAGVEVAFRIIEEKTTDKFFDIEKKME